MQNLLSKYATHNKNYKTKHCLKRHFVEDAYIRPERKSSWSEM